MDTSELTDRIYDTLLGNVGMSEYHVAITPDDITNQEVDARKGLIYLQIGLDVFELKVTKVADNSYFVSE